MLNCLPKERTDYRRRHRRSRHREVGILSWELGAPSPNDLPESAEREGTRERRDEVVLGSLVMRGGGRWSMVHGPWSNPLSRYGDLAWNGGRRTLLENFSLLSVVSGSISGGVAQNGGKECGKLAVRARNGGKERGCHHHHAEGRR